MFFGCQYAVIRINVVEFVANPSRNWTFQCFARAAQKKGRNGTNAALAKRWKVQFRKGLHKFNNVDSKTTYFNENSCIIYMYIYSSLDERIQRK